MNYKKYILILLVLSNVLHGCYSGRSDNLPKEHLYAYNFLDAMATVDQAYLRTHSCEDRFFTDSFLFMMNDVGEIARPILESFKQNLDGSPVVSSDEEVVFESIYESHRVRVTIQTRNNYCAFVEIFS